jgi:putative FmdB family regulatory protein
MPLYEYQCGPCGRFEVIRKFSDPPLDKCPTCGSEIQKLLSSPAIQFKGAGWYVTDYAKKSGGEGGKSEGGKNEGAKSEGGKSEGAKDSGAKESGTKSAESAASTSGSGKKSE